MADRCEATVLIRDDRSDGFKRQCEGPAGHGDPHEVAMGDCEPTAWLSWRDVMVETQLMADRHTPQRQVIAAYLDLDPGLHRRWMFDAEWHAAVFEAGFVVAGLLRTSS